MQHKVSLARRSKTKFQTVYPIRTLPNEIFEYSYPLNTNLGPNTLKSIQIHYSYFH